MFSERVEWYKFPRTIGVVQVRIQHFQTCITFLETSNAHFACAQVQREHAKVVERAFARRTLMSVTAYLLASRAILHSSNF